MADDVTVRKVRSEKDLEDVMAFCRKALKAYGRINISLSRARDIRSSAQNAYYWTVIIPAIVQYYQRNNKEFILDLLDPDFSAEFIHDMLKKKYNRNRSTTDLDTHGFTKYFDKIREDWFHRRGLSIPAPNEPPLEEEYNGRR